MLRIGSMVGFFTPLGREAMSTMHSMFMYPTVFMGIVLTEALGLRGSLHLIASFAGIVVSQVVAMGFTLLLYGGTNVTFVEARVIVSETAFVLRSLWIYTCAVMLLVVYFAFREHELAATKAAQDANTQRASVERATIAARLKVMQARVEPELLFGALRDVRTLYLRDRGAADAVLDDLIAYLRAALPQIRGDASTLGRETALAVAYANVLPAARNGELTAESSIPEDAQRLAFPPMVLLPLVRAAADSSASRITISLVEGESAVAIRLEPAATPAGWGERQLEAVRVALSNGFGPAATLEVENGCAIVRWAHHDRPS